MVKKNSTLVLLKHERMMKLRTGYSPYDMCNEAIRIIDAQQSENISKEDERQIILLLNKADSYAEMSTYQLSIARKRFADLYYSYGITGNALEQYMLALQNNPKLSIKRRLQELQKIPKSELIYSLDSNMIGEPNYVNLEYCAIKLDDEYLQEREDSKKNIAAHHGMTVEEYDHYINGIHSQLHQDALEDDAVYDTDFECKLEERVSHLPINMQNEFYRLRATKAEGPLSAKRQDILLLKSMEESIRSSNFHQNRVSSVDLASLKHVKYNPNIELQPEEIRLLSKVINKIALEYIPGYFTYEYHMDYPVVFERLFASGCLSFASLEFRIGKLTVSQLKEYLKSKNIPCNGKKKDLVNLVLKNCSKEFEQTIPEHFVATEIGMDCLRNNAALLNAYNSGMIGTLSEVSTEEH